MRRLMTILFMALPLATLGCFMVPAPVQAAAMPPSVPQHATAATSAPSPCRVWRITLHGQQPATAICMTVAAPHPGSHAPAIDFGDCGSADLMVYQDAGFGGQALCFTGTGTANLNDYILTCTVWWLSWHCPPQDQIRWSRQISSYQAGSWDGYFADSGNNALFFWANQSISWIGRAWNDRITTITIWG